MLAGVGAPPSSFSSVVGWSLSGAVPVGGFLDGLGSGAGGGRLPGDVGGAGFVVRGGAVVGVFWRFLWYFGSVVVFGLVCFFFGTVLALFCTGFRVEMTFQRPGVWKLVCNFFLCIFSFVAALCL